MPSKTLKRGSRRQVWNGKAEMTAGGLTKAQLTKNKNGRIVSVKKNATMRNLYKGSDSESDDEPVKEPVKKEETSKKEGGGLWSWFE